MSPTVIKIDIVPNNCHILCDQSWVKPATHWYWIPTKLDIEKNVAAFELDLVGQQTLFPFICFSTMLCIELHTSG